MKDVQNFTDSKSREWKDNNAEQYGMKGFYESVVVKPQMKAYDAMYAFSRGDVKRVPEEMHGEKVNVQKGP